MFWLLRWTLVIVFVVVTFIPLMVLMITLGRVSFYWRDEILWWCDGPVEWLRPKRRDEPPLPVARTFR